MNRDIWGRDRHDPRRFERDVDTGRDRRDFGQADYSEDYAYDPSARAGYRVERPETARDDYGQADFGRDYAYDPAARQGYRRTETPERDGCVRREEPRVFDSRASSRDRRRASHDRVIWAVVCERLDRARGLDASQIEVRVEDGTVFLDGTAKNRREKRRAEELAETEGVVDVVNGLRLRGHDGGGGWRRTFGF